MFDFWFSSGVLSERRSEKRWNGIHKTVQLFLSPIFIVPVVVQWFLIDRVSSFL